MTVWLPTVERSLIVLAPAGLKKKVREKEQGIATVSFATAASASHSRLWMKKRMPFAQT